MRKIALVGTAESGAAAPYKDETWEIWGVSQRGEYATRATRWFELHRLDGEPEAWANHWRKIIKTFSHDVDLYMFYPEPDLGPNVLAYPYEHITARFGTYFMSSTFSWMLAMAIDELRPAKGDPVDGEIGIWGVDMEYGTEYVQQRSGFRHFLQLAHFLGIRVSRFASTGLSYDPVPYPLWQDDPLLNKLELRRSLSGRKLNELDESIRHIRTLIAQDRAMIEELEKIGPDYDIPERLVFLKKELAGLMGTSAGISRDIVHWTATSEEQRWHYEYLQA